MAIPILKALLVVVILAVMILVLLGINHVFSGNFSVAEEEVDDLRSDLLESDNVISENGVFTELVEVKVSNPTKKMDI
ncbi:MAG: hypothetical protein K2N88_09105 [Muribaculaceae bacterium]|nr:hypothetical protein [Muribaculaceae bacterium]